jgi:lysophospholipase L1-like esterase
MRSSAERARGGRRIVGLPLLVAMAAAVSAPGPVTAQEADHWVVTWGTSPQLTEPRNLPPAPGLTDQTLRQIVHVSIPGERLRVHLSNEFGTEPVVVRRAHIALSEGAGSSTIVPGSDRALAFGGRPSVTIPPGEAVTSDPLDFTLPAFGDVSLSIAFGSTSEDVTGHPGSRTTSFLAPGDMAGAPELPDALTTEHWYTITGIDVVAAPSAAAVAVLGNSITDGRGSTTDGNDRWPDLLARRLQSDPRTADIAVLNSGIGGNCVLRPCLGPAGLERLDRDVLDRAGVRWLIVFEGVNDIGGARGPARSDSVAQGLIGAYQEIIRRAHEKGVLVYGATITPFGGSFYDEPGHEEARQTVNRWVRESGAFDAVIDFDAVVRDPDDPTRLREDSDTGDHLHPSAAGFQRMAAAIDLSLFSEEGPP